MSKVKTENYTEDPKIDSYEQIASKLKEHQRAAPAHVLLGEREQARARKQKLEAAAHDLGEGVSDSED